MRHAKAAATAPAPREYAANTVPALSSPKDDANAVRARARVLRKTFRLGGGRLERSDGNLRGRDHEQSVPVRGQAASTIDGDDRVQSSVDLLDQCMPMQSGLGVVHAGGGRHVRAPLQTRRHKSTG